MTPSLKTVVIRDVTEDFERVESYGRTMALVSADVPENEYTFILTWVDQVG